MSHNILPQNVNGTLGLVMYTFTMALLVVYTHLAIILELQRLKVCAKDSRFRKPIEEYSKASI
jgi:hypothetical protein